MVPPSAVEVVQVSGADARRLAPGIDTTPRFEKKGQIASSSSFAREAPQDQPRNDVTSSSRPAPKAQPVPSTVSRIRAEISFSLSRFSLGRG